jgi:hypothetical protein
LFFEYELLVMRRGVFLAIMALDINGKLPYWGSFIQSQNPIAGRLLSSRAYVLFRFVKQS